MKLLKELIKEILMEDFVDPRIKPQVKKGPLFHDKATQADFEKMLPEYPELDKIVRFFQTELQKAKLLSKISFLYGGYPEVHFDVNTPPSGLYDGMQLIYTPKAKEFEVSEFQAGPKNDQLHIYTVTKSPKVALKSLLLGNKNRKPIKIWD